MTILEEISESRRQDIPYIKKDITLLRKGVSNPPKRKKLSEVLNENPGIGIISELKIKSPSTGLLLNDKSISNHIDIQDILTPTCNNIKEIGDQMIKSGVYGISVITEPRYFSGSYGNLKQMCDIVSDKTPILLKEFIIDEAQIELGAICGASNGLIIPSICESLNIAKSMAKNGMEPLIELHNEEDLKKVMSFKGAPFSFVIGVNNRNLKDLKVDLTTTKKLVPKIREIFGPEQSIITESGISNRMDMLQMSRIGIKAALVGTSIMSQGLQEINKKICELSGNTRPFVKICGITDAIIFKKVNFQGITAIGVILNVPSSPRNITIEKAKHILDISPPFLQRTIVTKEKSVDEIVKYNEYLNPDLIQCKLDVLLTDPLTVPAKIRSKLLYPVRLSDYGTKKTIQIINSLPKDIFGIIIDSSEGEGTLIDIPSVKEVIKHCQEFRVIIAGGISSNNVIDIYEKINPFGIDISSSLETIKGIKDPDKILELKEKIKQITIKND